MPIPRLLNPANVIINVLDVSAGTHPVTGEPTESGDATFVQTPKIYTAFIGDINGVNKTFTVNEGVYVAGTLVVKLDGIVQTIGAEVLETTPGSGIFDFATAPETGQTVTIEYNKTLDDTVPVEIIIPGQWVPRDDQRLHPVSGGDSPENVGYIIVRAIDMEKIMVDYNGTFKKGDRIVSMGGVLVNAGITSLEHHSHYFEKPQLISLIYEDRQQGV